ncbi:hypothetical protein E2562_030501 [Oryza meyeriana var. granulata]|uniref:Uncharacterized protein n=1 Tax=Oryza meyeriana var. granulata TaxID=110450 RepID=A0A6G1BP07_9ORYZ|nr:hypothetical protein E2562_030501 [Oryza meyeriana var. granulata]
MAALESRWRRSSGSSSLGAILRAELRRLIVVGAKTSRTRAEQCGYKVSRAAQRRTDRSGAGGLVVLRVTGNTTNGWRGLGGCGGSSSGSWGAACRAAGCGIRQAARFGSRFVQAFAVRSVRAWFIPGVDTRRQRHLRATKSCLLLASGVHVPCLSGQGGNEAGWHRGKRDDAASARIVSEASRRAQRRRRELEEESGLAVRARDIGTALASSMAWQGSEAAGVVDALKAASLPSLESGGEDETRVACLRSWTAQVRRAGEFTGWEKKAWAVVYLAGWVRGDEGLARRWSHGAVGCCVGTHVDACGRKRKGKREGSALNRVCTASVPCRVARVAATRSVVAWLGSASRHGRQRQRGELGPGLPV